jgi:uncharacterized protein (TIGR00299 family) protein
MRTAYFDCFSGISGNMILGALIDLGLDVEELKEELGKLPLQGYQIEAKRIKKHEISAVYVDVVIQEDSGERTLKDILALIDHSTLTEDVQRLSKQIFTRLGEAEAKIHNQELSAVHFHEIGGVDTLVDVVGAVLGLKMLGLEQVICSPLNVGKGLVRTAHGMLPIPAPATVELLKEVPVYTGEVEGELTTPTGAAIITTVATDFCDMPFLTIGKVGYGAGKMDLEVPNLLRVLIGEVSEYPGDYATEYVTVIETNIDDMNPQFYDHIMERLLSAGALDVFLTPVQMKKNRPGILMSIITPRERVEKLLNILFEESTTLGVRIAETRRLSLPRSLHSVRTRFGDIRVKVARKGDTVVNIAPEYEDCKNAAASHDVTISQVYAEVQRAWNAQEMSD